MDKSSYGPINLDAAFCEKVSFRRISFGITRLHGAYMHEKNQEPSATNLDLFTEPFFHYLRSSVICLPMMS